MKGTCSWVAAYCHSIPQSHNLLPFHYHNLWVLRHHHCLSIKDFNANWKAATLKGRILIERHCFSMCLSMCMCLKGSTLKCSCNVNFPGRHHIHISTQLQVSYMSQIDIALKGTNWKALPFNVCLSMSRCGTMSCLSIIWKALIKACILKHHIERHIERRSKNA